MTRAEWAATERRTYGGRTVLDTPPSVMPAAFSLRAAGDELLGERWPPLIARMLGVSLRAVQRWSANQSDIPPQVAESVARLLEIVRRYRGAGASSPARSRIPLSEIGEEMFGFHWSTPLGNMLDVSARRVENWARGMEPMPSHVPQCVAELLAVSRESRTVADGENARRDREVARDNQDWANTGRNIADRYPQTLDRLKKVADPSPLRRGNI